MSVKCVATPPNANLNKGDSTVKEMGKIEILKKTFFVKYLFYNHLSTYCEDLDVTI